MLILVLISVGMCRVQLWAPTLVFIIQCPEVLSSLPGPRPRALQLPWNMKHRRWFLVLMTGREPSPRL